MMYKIIFSAIAIRDEADAYLFYEDQSEGLGEKFLDEIHEALQNISHHPTHYSYTDETKTMRDVSLNKFPSKSSSMFRRMKL